MPVIAIVVGAFAGGALGNGFFGAIVGALLGWLLWRSLAQQRELKLLQEAMLKWREAAQAAGVPRAQPAAEAEPVAVQVPVPVPMPTATPAVVAAPEVVAPEPEVPVTVPAPLRPEPVIQAAPPRARTAPAVPSEPDAFDRLRAWLVGGNTIAKAGVGILFVGLAFLAKYASDHALLPVELRLAGIAAVALVMLGLGWRLRAARPAYAQALQGGAVAVLYLTLFAAFRFYGVLAAGPVFTLMVAVAALAAALAVLQDARGLALIGALGGFATPLLVSTGSGNHVALFSYYLVLDLGIAAVAWFRNWRLLNAVGFTFTFGVATLWGVLRYEPAQYAVAQGFLIAYFLLFNAVLLMPVRRLAATPSRSDGWVNGGLLFGVPTFSFVLQHGLVRDWPYATALSALVLAGFYVAMAARLRRVPGLAVLVDAALAIATVFISLVIPFALDARSTAGAWALEGAGLLWLGFRQQRRLPRGFGYALLLLSGVTLALAHHWHGAPTAVFNAWFLNALLVAAGALAGAYFVHRGPKDIAEAMAEGLLIGWCLLWALAGAALEIELFATAAQSVSAWLLALSLIAAVFMGLSLRLSWTGVALPLMALAPALLLAALVGLALLDHPLQAGGWWAWPLALATLLAVLHRLAPQWPAAARHVGHAIVPVLLATLGAHGGGEVTRAWGDAATAWPWLGTLAVPALLLLLLPSTWASRRWPVRAEPVAYAVTASAVLAVGLLLWTLLANWWSTGRASPLPHVPLLNPLDLGVATALFAVANWLRHDGVRARLPSPAPLAVLAAVAFFWINAMLLRAFHHYGDVPYALEAWMDSLAVQTGVTLLWSATALALMWLSARRAQRVGWMVGAALLAAVVAKLLLVDLSGSGTVTRIVSFIGVGLLMLVIAYVAPLPSSREEVREAS